MVAELQARGLSASRTRQAYNLLGAMLTAAVADGLLVTSPCTGIKLPRLPRSELRYLAPRQVSALSAAMPAPFDLLVDMLAYGGLRFGEAAALRRGRCELPRGRIRVAESLTEVNGRLVFGATKTHQHRLVTLPPSLCDELARHLAERVAPEPSALVFTGRHGGALRCSNVMRMWRRAATRAGMERVTPHLLRHTSATLLIDAGASVKDVQAHLGHADGAVTLNIYSAVMHGRSDELAQRLEALRQAGLSNGSGTDVARASDLGPSDEQSP